MGKVYTHFQTKTAQKPYPMGWHLPIIMAYIREYPPRPEIYSDHFAVFTPLQFVAAGDHLVHHCPTWKWCVLIL